MSDERRERETCLVAAVEAVGIEYDILEMMCRMFSGVVLDGKHLRLAQIIF